MHRRKKYTIYKRDYNPLTDTYQTRYSKYQAWKCAMRMGAGSSVMACVYQHPGPFKMWTGSWSEDLWVVGCSQYLVV